MNALEELTGEAAAAALRTTAIDIQVASLLPRELGFFAGHNHQRSIFVLHVEGATTVWKLEGGTKEARRRVADRIRADLNASVKPKP